MAENVKLRKIGFCLDCHQLVELDEKGNCKNGHAAHRVRVEGVVPDDGPLPKIARINIGALFMPPIWGPAHGMWPTILFYPLWVFVDSCLMAARTQGGSAIPVAILVVLGTAAITIWFAVTAQAPAYMRVAGRMTVEQFNKRERIWAVISIVIALVFVALATYYNLFLYESVHGV